MSVAACTNCGAVQNVRCVDDRCCERDDRDAAFLTTVGQSWQSEADRLLDAWASAAAEKRRLMAIARDHADKVDAAERACCDAEQAFDTFMHGCMKVRAQAMSL